MHGINNIKIWQKNMFCIWQGQYLNHSVTDDYDWPRQKLEQTLWQYVAQLLIAIQLTN